MNPLNVAVSATPITRNLLRFLHLLRPRPHETFGISDGIAVALSGGGGIQMIEGFRIDVTAEEMGRHLDERIEYHRGRAQDCELKVQKLKAVYSDEWTTIIAATRQSLIANSAYYDKVLRGKEAVAPPDVESQKGRENRSGGVE